MDSWLFVDGIIRMLLYIYILYIYFFIFRKNSLQNTKVLGIGAMVYIPNGELLCTERVEWGGGEEDVNFLGELGL